MPRVADTSFLYAAFDEADPRHTEARDEIAKPQALHIPLAVLAEFLDLVDYRHGREVALAVYGALTQLATVAITALRDEDAALDVWKAHPPLSVVDAIGVQACAETKATLLSYDHGQLEALAAVAK